MAIRSFMGASAGTNEPGPDGIPRLDTACRGTCGTMSDRGSPEDQMAERPANHGQSSHGLRGDYSRMRPDYTVDQDPASYGPVEHDRWRRLYRRQIELVDGRACEEYVAALRALPYEQGVPRFDEVNRALGAATGWQIVAVPGLVPDLVFFEHLANRRFPVTWWLRDEQEFDYIVEPDVFHDFFGHVPMLFTPTFADYMQAYGRGGLKAEGLGALSWLARLYWYTVEFGLLRTGAGLRVYGAGILSSPSEIDFAVRSPRPRRVGFELVRIMRSRYRIDAFQETYFVIESFGQLFAATAPDFAPIYRELSLLPELAADAALPTDRLVS
jgi:phenylalanine-4-hydroxylase